MGLGFKGLNQLGLRVLWVRLTGSEGFLNLRVPQLTEPLKGTLGAAWENDVIAATCHRQGKFPRTRSLCLSMLRRLACAHDF